MREEAPSIVHVSRSGTGCRLRADLRPGWNRVPASRWRLTDARLDARRSRSRPPPFHLSERFSLPASLVAPWICATSPRLGRLLADALSQVADPRRPHRPNSGSVSRLALGLVDPATAPPCSSSFCPPRLGPPDPLPGEVNECAGRFQGTRQAEPSLFDQTNRQPSPCDRQGKVPRGPTAFCPIEKTAHPSGPRPSARQDNLNGRAQFFR